MKHSILGIISLFTCVLSCLLLIVLFINGWHFGFGRLTRFICITGVIGEVGILLGIIAFMKQFHPLLKGNKTGASTKRLAFALQIYIFALSVLWIFCDFLAKNKFQVQNQYFIFEILGGLPALILLFSAPFIWWRKNKWVIGLSWYTCFVWIYWLALPRL